MTEQIVQPINLDTLEAKLHAEGLETAEITAVITQLRHAREGLINLAIENRELEALFDLKHRREVECISRWQEEDPKGRALTLPDYGSLLDWMHARLLIFEAGGKG